ncbi:MAG: NmrA family NAD(P)-binding protein, partial [Bacteroidetes bacterium]|nr:NmrA family NAD(P)-binding protein [Bacteroidota bacterium]
MKNTLILVTGAAGKTGAAGVEQLLERGFPVRALVHRQDNRSARLAW